jgi:trk system potassium uptake protein TrkA
MRNPQNESIFKKLGIDVTVSSTNVILQHIQEEVPTHPLIHLLTIRDRGLEIVEIKITPEAIAVGKRVRELSLPEDCRLALVIPEGQKPRVPTKDTLIQAGDRLIAVTTPDSKAALQTALRGSVIQD